MCSYCSCCGCCRVTKAAIKVAGGTAIGTTYSTVVKIASGIGGAASGIRMSFTDLACCTSCLGIVGVRGDVSALKWDGAYIDEAYINRAYTDGAYRDGAYRDKTCTDGVCGDGAFYKAFYRASCGA